MDNVPSVSDAQVLIRLVLLAALWAGTVVHLLRVLDGFRLPHRDVMADFAHVFMGAAMTFMIFPGAPMWVQPVLAVPFAGVAVFFLLRAVGRAHGPRPIDVVMAAGNAAMALMLADDHSGRIVSLAVACGLVGCAAVHLHLLFPRTRAAGIREGQRFLEVGPQLAAVVMTLVMASMFAFT